MRDFFHNRREAARGSTATAGAAMRVVKLLYGVLMVWSVVVIIFAAVSMVSAPPLALGAIAAAAIAATAVPYIIVRSLEKIVA